MGWGSCIWRHTTVLTATQASKLREMPAADRVDYANRCRTTESDVLVACQVNPDVVVVAVDGQPSEC